MLEEEDSINYNDTIGCSIIYLFYPAENPHKQMTLRAVSTLKVLPDICDISLALRQNVSEFNYQDLKDKIDITVSAIVIEKSRQLTSSDKCCHAISW